MSAMCGNHELQTTKEMLKDNIAAGKAVTASTDLWYSDVAVSKVADEDLLTFLQARVSVTEEPVIDLGGIYKITDVELYNFYNKEVPYTVSELQLSSNGAELTVSGSLTKDSGTSGNISALLIVAQYDADKKLVGTRCFPITSESIEETVGIPSNAVSAQAFIFADLQSAIPLGANAGRTLEN